MDELVSEKIETRFYYVSTESNPADCATRGLNASEIVDHTWWHGPGFILAPPTQWPNAHMDFTVDPPPLKDVEEEFRTVASSASLIEGYKSFVPFTRMTSYSKLVRVTAWCLKYLAKLLYRIKAKLQTADTTLFSKFTKASHISIDDFREAELIVLREHYREGALLLESRNIRKLHVKSDENGLFRADIRMANSELEESAKRPIVLLPGHPLTQVIIRHYHLKLFHAGAPHLISALREKYLIPNIRRKVKTIIAKCITCKRQQGRPYSYPECPSLPAERVSHTHEFLMSSYQELRSSLEQFWNIWYRDYLQALAEKTRAYASPKRGSRDWPKVGDVVLLRQENASRMFWPLGIIIELNKSVDGAIRSVQVRTRGAAMVATTSQLEVLWFGHFKDAPATDG
ncbi:hypothetical protein ANCDUO_24139 [Ancylostoma duodenale]|uniref:Integrase zinc-binding domain-containing protein n=1 Tax=Ancylostoma duodenale TaxID=51022 RepID=A0A0C2FB88_9BILA|nr:hypothetical protein ANCDUO_24139 [Ancylostoma duodenale]